MKRRILLYATFLFILLTAASNAPASTPPSNIDSLRQSLLALESAWTRAINDLQFKKQSNSLKEFEQQDYAKFITYLSSRIDHYCHRLTNEGGKEAIANLPCPEGILTDFGQNPAAHLTKAEQIAELDKSLAEALGEFDEQLLKEDQRIASRIPVERESGRGSGNSGQYGSGQPGDAAQGGIGGKKTEGEGARSGSDSSQDAQGSSTPYSGAGQGSEEQMENRSTGSQEISSGYDDIVARQLREAAEKETDPELKKKLWEEYRKYKEGVN